MTNRNDTSTTAENWQQIHQAQYEADHQNDLATTIIFAIADATAVEPLALKSPPLYDSIDAAAVEDTFFRHESPTTVRDNEGYVAFTYRNYRITVRSDGWVFVHEPA